MRTLKLRFPDDALPTLDTFVKHTKDARVFRRAQAVRNVVKGQPLQTVSDTLQFTYSALRKWVYRFAHQGTQGLVDRPRSGRPPKVTCALERYLNHLVDQDPLEHGSIYSQWSCRDLATVLARETGIPLGRETVRGVLKKMRGPTAALPADSIPTRPTSPMARSTSLHWNTAHAGARLFCSMKPKQSCGVLPCPVRAGGAKPSARASRHVRCVRVRSNVRRRGNARRGCRIAPGGASPGVCCSASSVRCSMAPRKSSIKSCPTLMPRSCASISIKSWRLSAPPAKRS